MFLINELISLLAANLILMQALGTSTLFIAADSRRNLVGTALTITLFTTVGTAFTYLVNGLLPENMADLTLLLYTLIIGVIYVILLSAFYFLSRKNFEKYRKYIHISAFNCAVMGTFFTVSAEAAEGKYTGMLDWVSAGARAGLGFVTAALILTAAYRKLNSAKVPSSFRGFPSMLVYLGIISMAVYALK